MITGKNLHDAWKSVRPDGWYPFWDGLNPVEQERYRRMSTALEVRSGICPKCASIPAEGLSDIDGKLLCGHDCPGVDSEKWCDHRTVGALIRNEKGNILLFHRNTYPFAVAGPAGHCDGDEEEFAIRAEVQQETGLLVLSANVMAQFWHHSRCRRRYAGNPGHMWTVYDVHATGQLVGSEREVQVETLRWHTSDEVAQLVSRTTRKLTGEEPDGATLDLPWYEFFIEEMGYEA